MNLINTAYLLDLRFKTLAFLVENDKKYNRIVGKSYINSDIVR